VIGFCWLPLGARLFDVEVVDGVSGLQDAACEGASAPVDVDDLADLDGLLGGARSADDGVPLVFGLLSHGPYAAGDSVELLVGQALVSTDLRPVQRVGARVNELLLARGDLNH
jgi:hypothetical protein